MELYRKMCCPKFCFVLKNFAEIKLKFIYEQLNIFENICIKQIPSINYFKDFYNDKSSC